MYRILTIFLLAAFTLSVSAASRTELNANIRAAITELKTNPAADELAQASAGMLVFPKVVKGGFIVGGEYGKGALLVGGSIIQYYRLASVSVGFQAGGQARSRVILFMTPAALEEFRYSDGWEVGIDGSITAIQFGVDKQIDTNTMRDPIIGFTFKNKGLMGGVSFEGSKFWKDGDPIPKKLAAN
jgi:lipid-binding SYLF domain-containing protein